MESGWTRWVLESFAFEFELVYPPDIDAGDLRSKYDCIILPNGAIPGGGRGGPPAGGNVGGGEGVEFDLPQQQGQSPLADDPTIPAEWRRRIGSMSSKSTEKLREFVDQGGHLLCIGSSALNIARQLKLPIQSALVDEKGVALPSTKFYIPGSLLRAKLNAGAITAGMGDSVDVMFDNSPAFRLEHGASADVVALYDSAKPLRSGWAWGQESLKDAAAIVDVPLGKGHVVLYGPEILFRGQSDGTFKLLFNAIFRAARRPASQSSR
jgi:hypothetical protein